MMRRRDLLRAGGLVVPSLALGQFGRHRNAPGTATPRLTLYDGVNLGYGFSDEGKPSDWSRYIRRTQSANGVGTFTFPGGDTSELPTEASVRSRADAVNGTADTDMIDIESWSEATQADRLETAGKVVTMSGWWLDQYPGSKVGWYGWPNNGPRADIIAGSGAGYDAWKAGNDDLNFFDAAGVDMMMPSLYVNTDEAAPYTDTKAWIAEILNECKRLSDVRIAPFVWGVYHQGAAGLNGDIVDISTDNPAQVTVGTDEAAGLVTGYKVRMQNLTGSDELEQTVQTITVIDDETFSLDGIDGAAITGYTSGGTYEALVPQAFFDAILETIALYTAYAVYWDYWRVAGVGPDPAEVEKMPSWAAIKASRLLQRPT